MGSSWFEAKRLERPYLKKKKKTGQACSVIPAAQAKM
jgi:hypothetical protein